MTPPIERSARRITQAHRPTLARSASRLVSAVLDRLGGLRRRAFSSLPATRRAADIVRGARRGASAAGEAELCMAASALAEAAQKITVQVERLSQLDQLLSRPETPAAAGRGSEPAASTPPDERQDALADIEPRGLLELESARALRSEATRGPRPLAPARSSGGWRVGSAGDHDLPDLVDDTLTGGFLADIGAADDALPQGGPPLSLDAGTEAADRASLEPWDADSWNASASSAGATSEILERLALDLGDLELGADAGV